MQLKAFKATIKTCSLKTLFFECSQTWWLNAYQTDQLREYACYCCTNAVVKTPTVKGFSYNAPLSEVQFGSFKKIP